MADIASLCVAEYERLKMTIGAWTSTSISALCPTSRNKRKIFTWKHRVQSNISGRGNFGGSRRRSGDNWRPSEICVIATPFCQSQTSCQPVSALQMPYRQACMTYANWLLLKNKAHEANDASSWWWNDCMMTRLLISVTDWQTGKLTNWQTDGSMDCLIEMLSCFY